MRDHGGRLQQAAQRYHIPLCDWLDLSTGINPEGWPVPAVPTNCWSRLPEDEDGLEQAARHYYQAKHLLPLPGSQAAIQVLPKLRPYSQVAVLSPGYNEHEAAWRSAGHSVSLVSARDMGGAITESEVVVITSPNNPTGTHFSIEQLLQWQHELAQRNGWLLIDEAFMDTTPELSLCPETQRPGLIVLRSPGKFFGLAGARVGFVFTQPTLLLKIQQQLGPWSVNGPARWVVKTALKDSKWQESARIQLNAKSIRLCQLLRQYNLKPQGGCALFQWICTPEASRIHEGLALRGILCRLFNTPSSLRFGLPNRDADWARLTEGLSELSRNLTETMERKK